MLSDAEEADPDACFCFLGGLEAVAAEGAAAETTEEFSPSFLRFLARRVEVEWKQVVGIIASTPEPI